jgi:hypothetical protein
MELLLIYELLNQFILLFPYFKKTADGQVQAHSCNLSYSGGGD